MTYELSLGAIAPPLRDQLREQGLRFTTQNAEQHIEKMRAAWNLLRIHGMITDAESNKSARRIMKHAGRLLVPTQEAA